MSYSLLQKLSHISTIRKNFFAGSRWYSRGAKGAKSPILNGYKFRIIFGFLIDCNYS